MSVLKKQVGGSHYTGMKYQPVEFASKVRLNFVQGSILKYVSRYKNKSGKQDLEKAVHFCQLGAETSPVNFAITDYSTEVEKYIKQNGMPNEMIELIENIINQFWIGVSTAILEISEKEYGKENQG